MSCWMNLYYDYSVEEKFDLVTELTFKVNSD